MIPQAKKWVSAWLAIGLILVFVQVVIGGITRLTDSGLSITEWELVKGVIPPLNEDAWNIAFENPNRDETDLEGNTTTEKINFIDNIFRHTIVGIELFPDKGFNLRLGYNFRRGEELRIIEKRAFAGISAGFSVKFNKLRLSYSYAKYSSAAASSYFGLMLNLQ